MEEAELLKERLQAITDKRKIREDIAQKRTEIEEEKLKLQYLKKKALREKWLMDGLSSPSVPEEMALKLQAQDNQQQTKILESNISRIENEIEALERQEMMISTNESLILKKLKEVERSAEDIIKAVKADVKQEPIEYIYSEIPDLPKSYRPTNLKKMPSPEQQMDNEQSKKALFAMEINVEKDMKTGESQVLSTATVTPEAFQEKGIKVYDDGRKSVYALCSDREVAHNGVDELTPIEVEELLRKATEKKSKTALEYHEPVFSSSYSRPSTPRRRDRPQASPEPNGLQESPEKHTPMMPELAHNDMAHFQEEMASHIPHRPDGPPKFAETSPNGKTNQSIFSNGDETHLLSNIAKSEPMPYQDSRDAHHAAVFVNSVDDNKQSAAAYPDDPKCNVLHAMPTSVANEEPVTMIFMGYQCVEDDVETQQGMGFEGAIRAELVVIGDDDDNELQPSYHPDGYHSKVFQPSMNSRLSHYLPDTEVNCSTNNVLAYSDSVPLQDQETRPNHVPNRTYSDGQTSRDATEDISVTALRMRMTKLGKRM
ncbi:palmdelphin [Lepisosteus oculatus]|uniref:Palmdelphin n=1 Tax=Lepisosteus oculatus TaxID=7918 RepID=W5LY92_LEPOC|nr:PREDICTED: palmdelphin [Lepisosteus oculatus]